MIVWLDGESNTKEHPNENFARELMELFTCGIGNYTENDVREAARAFTGWHREGAEFAFRPDEHDTGRKKFLGKSGRLDGADVVDILMQHPATPRVIATKLLRFFAAPEPAADVVDEATALLVRTRLDVKWFLRELFLSRWFFSEACYRTRLASPVEFVVGSMRTLGARWAAARAGRPSRHGWASGFTPLRTSRAGTARRPGSIPARWPPVRRSPRTSRDSTPTTILWPTPSISPSIVPAEMNDPAKVVEALSEVLMQGDLSTETRAAIASFLVTPDEDE